MYGSNEEINCYQRYTNHEVPDAISENHVKNPMDKGDTQTEFHNVADITSSASMEDINRDKMKPVLGGYLYGENPSDRGNTKRHKGKGKKIDFKQKERHDCHSNSSKTPQPEVTSIDLEEKGSSNTLPEDDEEFHACQEAVIDGVSISQQEESSKAEALQIKDVDK